MEKVVYRDTQGTLSKITKDERGRYVLRSVSSNANKITQTTHRTFEKAFKKLEKRSKGLRELGDI